MPNIRELAEARYGLPVDVGDSESETVRVLLGHRSCRRLEPESLADGLINLLLACTQSAPTKSNLQQYSIVVADADKRAEIAVLVPSMPWVAVAPLLLVFPGRRATDPPLGRMARSRLSKQQRRYVHERDDRCRPGHAGSHRRRRKPRLGTCPISYIRNRIDDLAEILRLPDGVFPITGLAVGWPAASASTSLRLPPDIVVHRDVYDDSALEHRITAYDDRAHAYQPLPPAKQRHTEKYGALEKCTWSENVARQLSVPERQEFACFPAGEEDPLGKCPVSGLKST